MKIVLGIDGGGTKTRAVAYTAGSDGRLSERCLGRADAGACNIAGMPVAEALANVRAACIGTGVRLEDVSSVCTAVAGYSFQSRRAEFHAGLNELFPSARLQVAPDYAAAFRGALPEGSGILVIAGTGSIAYGGDARTGKSHRAGGYGYIIDDSGSGYGVGRAALAAVLAAGDGAGELTTLTGRVAEALGTVERDAIIERIYGGAIDRVQIADLARIASAAAEQESDSVALQILMRAGGALARLAEAVHRDVFGQMELEDAPLKIACIGSLWKAGASLTGVFERSCLRFAPGVEFVDPADDPAVGAALMAMDQ